MKTVLIVEDSTLDLALLSNCLQQIGMQVLSATSSEEALTQLQQIKPDVILIDVMLPGRSGFDLCREIKQQQSTSQIPIVFCSAKSEKLDRVWGIRQGAAAYLGKPVDQDELHQLLRQLISV